MRLRQAIKIVRKTDARKYRWFDLPDASVGQAKRRIQIHLRRIERTGSDDRITMIQFCAYRGRNVTRVK